MKPHPMTPRQGATLRKCGASFFAMLLCLLFACRLDAARGRPVINASGTTFVSNTRTLLRGAIVSTETGLVPSLASVQAIKNHGLNTIHCYAERHDYGYAAGAKVAALDAVVQMTRDNGLYTLIRANAPHTPVLFFSYMPGRQILRFSPLSAGFKANWIELAPATTGLTANGTYKLLNRGSSLAMDVVNKSTANGAKVQQWSYSATTNQQWVFTHRGANQYTITSVQTGKCLDQASATALSGDYISMWPLSGSAGGAHQQWLIAMP